MIADIDDHPWAGVEPAKAPLPFFGTVHGFKGFPLQRDPRLPFGPPFKFLDESPWEAPKIHSLPDGRCRPGLQPMRTAVWQSVGDDNCHFDISNTIKYNVDV